MENKPIPYRLTTEEERENMENEQEQVIQELIDKGFIFVEIQYKEEEEENDKNSIN